VEVRHLRCDYLVDPLGIDAVQPRLSWEIQVGEQESAVRGLKQTAYQILVASSDALLAADKGDLWDSGKVASDQQNQVAYAGKPLESKMRCHWKVRVWTSKGASGFWHFGNASCSGWSKPALWTMGLLKPEDWQAKWIELDDVIPDNAFEREITEGKLVIKKALYSGTDKTRAVDLTEKFNGMIDKGTLMATLTPKALGVDPGPGLQHLRVDYEYNGKPCVLETPTAHRLGDIYLPSGTRYQDTPEGLKERARWWAMAGIAAAGCSGARR